jgi:beta-carotene hydroxylase
MQWGFERSIFFVIVLAAIRFDFLPFVFNCWFAPALMVGVTLGLFFDYLPHRPFTSRNRWTNARIYPGQLMNWLIMGQNYHLVHHLWPSIPWFEYKSAYEATKPLLDSKGAPQRLGIFETQRDGYNFLYDILVGVRSHKRRRGKMRRVAKVLPARRMQRRWLSFVDSLAIKTEPKRWKSF